ncbi:MAG: antirestriction protein ArdA [Muribaculaceae bacterium]|nr:antirestriction protein ArdA [Muribaculaceae bacterium]
MCLLNSYYTNDVQLSQEEIDYHKHNIYSDSPAVYVGTYHKYNCGSLAGMWVDLSTFVDYAEFIDFCHALHCDEADPELMFQDYENFPRQLYSESCFDEETFDTIIEYANHDQEAVDAFLCVYDISELDKFDEAYVGEFYDEADFARHIIDECYTFDGILADYFDYDSFAEDLFMTDYYFDNGHVIRR